LKPWLLAIVLLALLAGGTYGYVQFINGSNSGHGAPYEVSTASTTMAVAASTAANATVSTETSTRTSSQTMEGRVESVAKPPLRFRGPTYTAEVRGLKIVATLSSPSVRVGGTLWIKVSLTGKKAGSVNSLRVIIVNSEGWKVYDVYTWLPHGTATPGTQGTQGETYNIAWRATKHPSANVEVTPGNYTIIMKAMVNGEEVVVKGTAEVVG